MRPSIPKVSAIGEFLTLRLPSKFHPARVDRKNRLTLFEYLFRRDRQSIGDFLGAAQNFQQMIA